MTLAVLAVLPLEQLLVIPAGILLVILGTILVRLRRDRENRSRAEPEATSLAIPAAEEPAVPPGSALAVESPASPSIRNLPETRKGLRLGLLALICGPVAGLVLGLVSFVSEKLGLNYRIDDLWLLVILGAVAGVLGGVFFVISALASIRWSRNRSAEPAATVETGPD